MISTYQFLKPDKRLETLEVTRGKLKFAEFSRESKEVIKHCCKLQIQSYRDVSNIDFLIEIRESGYDVTLEELNAESASSISEYNKVLNCPSKLFLLDAVNLGLFKHHLFNEYYDTEDEDKAADIWKAISLLQESDICLN